MEWLGIIILAAAAAMLGRAFLRNPSEGVHLPKRPLLLVAVCSPGDQPSQALQEWALECLSQELGLEVYLGQSPLLIPMEALHPKRAQGDAVHLVGLVEGLVTQDRAVLGITEYDLHSPLRRDLPFALGARKGRAGLVSTYRMEDKRSSKNTEKRLRKMLVRYGAELVCDAPRDDDPTSVLYSNLQSPEQLDIMQWP
jgi:hypothetical protein